MENITTVIEKIQQCNLPEKDKQEIIEALKAKDKGGLADVMNKIYTILKIADIFDRWSGD